MPQYFISKTGMEIFDLSRTYGLAAILYYLGGGDVVIKDFDYYFLVDCSSSPNLNRIPNLNTLITENLDWRNVIRTGNVNKSREIINKWIKDKNNIAKTLDKYSSLKLFDIGDCRTFISLKGKKIRKMNLIQSMEPRATKGFRKETLRAGYDEGSNIPIPLEDWTLSLIGHLNSTVFFEGERRGKRRMSTKSIGILPYPSLEGTLIDVIIRDISGYLRDNLRWHSAGVLSTVTYSAISLRIYLLQNRMQPSIRRSKISSLLFYCMKRSPKLGAQWKPEETGKFDLNYIERYPLSVLEVWEDLFRRINLADFRNEGDFKDTAVYLSELIYLPNIDNLLRYLLSHQKMRLRCQSKGLNAYIPQLFSEDAIEEVLKNVRTL